MSEINIKKYVLLFYVMALFSILQVWEGEGHEVGKIYGIFLLQKHDDGPEMCSAIARPP